MNEELVAIADDELTQLNALIDCLSIPAEVAKSCLLSGSFMELLQGNEAYAREREEHCIKFDTLCNATPHASRECLKMLSLAYFCIIEFFRDDANSQADQSIRSGAIYLTNAAMARGAATALLPPTATEGGVASRIASARREKLAQAGLKGAKGRIRNFEPLKQWVDENWNPTHGTSLDVARKLAEQLPPHLPNKSPATARLIYDTIRAKATTK